MVIRLLASLASLDPGRLHLRRAVRTLGAALAALFLTGALARVAHRPGSLAVVAVVVVVIAARRPVRAWALVQMPVAGAVAAVIGAVMVRQVTLGVAVFVAAVFGARLLVGRGGRARRFGRLALAPLVALFVVPVPAGASGTAPGPLWAAAACVIAVGCVWAAQRFVLPARPGRDAAAAARAFVRGVRHGRGPAAVHRAALAVDEAWPPAGPLSAAVVRAEALAEGDPADPRLAAALGEVEALAGELRSAGGGATGQAVEAAPVPSAAASSVHTRLAAQLAAALALAFAAGHLLLPDRWNWPVVTAFVVCVAARSRGDVVHRSVMRILGAVSGALAATPVAYALHGLGPGSGRTAWSVAVIFGFLFVGVWLRDIAYAAWAFCVTGLLAVLYTLHGDSGTASALLLQRPAGILLGSACAIAAAFLVLPVRTERLLRARTATALRALQSAVAAEPDELPLHARAFDRALADLRTLRLIGRASPVPDLLARCAVPLRALAVTAPAPPARARTAANIACVRRKLGRRPDAHPPAPLPEGAPLADLNAALAALYAHV